LKSAAAQKGLIQDAEVKTCLADRSHKGHLVCHAFNGYLKEITYNQFAIAILLSN